MDQAGCGHAHMAWHSARRRELAKETAHAFHILRDLRVDLCVCPFKRDMREDCRTSMTWPREVDHIDIVILDKPVQVDIDEAQAGRCAPVSEQAGLDMFGAQWFSQQRVIL